MQKLPKYFVVKMVFKGRIKVDFTGSSSLTVKLFKSRTIKPSIVQKVTEADSIVLHFSFHYHYFKIGVVEVEAAYTSTTTSLGLPTLPLPLFWAA